MAMVKRFTENVMVRLSKAGKKGLDHKAKLAGVGPAVAARLIIEHYVISNDDIFKQAMVLREHEHEKGASSK